MDNKPPNKGRKLKKNSWNQTSSKRSTKKTPWGGGGERGRQWISDFVKKEGRQTPPLEGGGVRGRQLGANSSKKRDKKNPPLGGGEKEDDCWDQPSPNPMTLPERAMFA